MDEDLLALVTRRLSDQVELAHRLAEGSLAAQVTGVCEAFVETYRRGGQALFAGNGGSAAQAAHAAAEFVGRCTRDRRPLPALSLTDPVVLSALANDFGYEESFARQVEAYGRSGDLLVVFSTSGRSANVLRAISVARARGLTTVALSGGDGGLLVGAADHVLLVPADRTTAVQEAHSLWCHIWAEAVEVSLFSEADHGH